MRQKQISLSMFRVFVAILLVTGSLTVALPKASMAGDSLQSTETTPQQILAVATTYLKNLPQFFFEAEITEDEELEDGIMAQSVSNLAYSVKRPNKIRFRIDDDDRDKEWYYDGKVVNAYDYQTNFYSREAFPPTIDAAIAKAREELNLRPSIIGLARTDLYEGLTENVKKMRIVGLSRVNGISC